MYWGNKNFGKKIKEQTGHQNVFKKGSWGLRGASENLGLYGFRGTPQENAEIGKLYGKKDGSLNKS